MRYLVLMRLPVRFNITAEVRNKREARVLCLVRLIPLLPPYDHREGSSWKTIVECKIFIQFGNVSPFPKLKRQTICVYFILPI